MKQAASKNLFFFIVQHLLNLFAFNSSVTKITHGCILKKNIKDVNKKEEKMTPASKG